MSIYKRKDAASYFVDVRWVGYPRIRVSTDTTNKSRAKAMESTLHALRSAGRRDVLTLLAHGKLRLCDVHDDYSKDPAALEQRLARQDSPELGPLVDEWLAWLRSPAAVSARTRRRYAELTVHRYAMSWERWFRIIPTGRAATLTDVTKGLVADFRERRSASGTAAGTVNRDLCALGAFLTWCQEERGLTVSRPKVKREREPAGRERWLSAEEIRRLHAETQDEWWPLFATLLFTGLRVGEAQGLLGEDVMLTERRISVREGARRLKTAASARDVPIPEPLAAILGEHFARTQVGPADLVFPLPLGDYRAARRVFTRACKAAKLHGITLHDLRHTYGVHAAMTGVPIVRLQKLLGHATPHMTMRYMKHAPESYFAEDAAKIAAGLTRDREAEARAEAARSGLGVA